MLLELTVFYLLSISPYITKKLTESNSGGSIKGLPSDEGVGNA
jgi:hypothetical protein